MPLDNALNVSELLRRLGVEGDSLGSAPLLESIRLSLIIGDFSSLVPPLGGAIAGAALTGVSAVGTFNKWSLECRGPGGVIVDVIGTRATSNYRIDRSGADVFGPAFVGIAARQFSFSAPARSLFRNHAAGAVTLNAASYQGHGSSNSTSGTIMRNLLGPGEFFNIESMSQNVTETMNIMWREFSGAINPGQGVPVQ